MSRSQAREAIVAGRVAVDGLTCVDPDRWVEPGRGLRLDGAPLTRRSAVVFAFYKPVGVVTTRSDERGRRTVYDLLPAGLPWLSPVGRLDLDSSGLLLLTNDTRLGAAVAGPESEIGKVYDVTLDGPLGDAELTRFATGMRLDDGTQLLPVRVQTPFGGDRRRVLLELREGKNRQIRRMAASIGRVVVRLHRTAVGPVSLGTLQPGGLRSLTDQECLLLRALAGRAASRRNRR
jgi:23S rRNA pseudouridine2605 synthase